MADINNQDGYKRKEPMQCHCNVFPIIPGVNVTLRRITAADLKEVHRILIWGTTLEDIETYFRVRPDAFYGAFLTESPQQIVAHIMVAAWAKDYCMIGWYVTDAQYRGRGIGSRLFDWSRQPMGDRIQILEADPTMDKMYMDLGFERFRSIQWISGAAKLPIQTQTLCKNIDFQNANDDNFNLIQEYDKQFHKVDRSTLLHKLLISQSQLAPLTSNARIFTKLAVRNRKCVGFASMRRDDERCYVICPLMADDAAVANALLRELIVDYSLEGETLEICVPLKNIDETLRLASKYGVDMFKEFEHVMCTKPTEAIDMFNDIPWNKIYGLMGNSITAI